MLLFYLSEAYFKEWKALASTMRQLRLVIFNYNQRVFSVLSSSDTFGKWVVKTVVFSFIIFFVWDGAKDGKEALERKLEKLKENEPSYKSNLTLEGGGWGVESAWTRKSLPEGAIITVDVETST